MKQPAGKLLASPTSFLAPRPPTRIRPLFGARDCPRRGYAARRRRSGARARAPLRWLRNFMTLLEGRREIRAARLKARTEIHVDYARRRSTSPDGRDLAYTHSAVNRRGRDSRDALFSVSSINSEFILRKRELAVRPLRCEISRSKCWSDLKRVCDDLNPHARVNNDDVASIVKIKTTRIRSRGSFDQFLFGKSDGQKNLAKRRSQTDDRVGPLRDKLRLSAILFRKYHRRAV